MNYRNVFILVFMIIGATANQRVNPLRGQKATDIVAQNLPNFTDHTQKGEIPHISFDAYSKEGGRIATKKLVRKMMVDGLREKFIGFKHALTRFADPDGFVRSGIVYCNAANNQFEKIDPLNAGLASELSPIAFHPATGRLIEFDGFGQDFDERFNTTGAGGVCTSVASETGEAKDLCDPSSFVGMLAATIRSIGLMVQHQDICDAVIQLRPCERDVSTGELIKQCAGGASTCKTPQPIPTGCMVFPDAYTTTLRPFTFQATPADTGSKGARFEHGCGTLREFGRQSHFERNELCFGKDKDDCEALSGKSLKKTDTGKTMVVIDQLCEYFPRERLCFAKESSVTSTGGRYEDENPDRCDILPNQYWNKIEKPVALVKNSADADVTADVINAVRRTTSYGLTSLSVEATDYNYVTGCQQDAEVDYHDKELGPVANASTQYKISKCGNLRSLVTALNGNAQINAFRHLGLEEAGEHWAKQIAVIKAYLVDFAYTMRNFRDMSLEIWPEIEYEEVQGCPKGETEFDLDHTGTDIEPLCYRNSSDIVKILKQDKTGQGFDRQRCFCRNGKLGRSKNYAFNLPNDCKDISCSYTPDTGSNDGAYFQEPHRFEKIERDDLYLSVELENCDDKTMPVSVYTYCRAMGSLGDIPEWKNTLRSLLPSSTESRSHIFSHDTDTVLTRRRTIRNNLEKTFPQKLDTSCGRIVNADSETLASSVLDNGGAGTVLLRSNKGGNCLPFPKLYEIIYRLEFEGGKQDMGSYVEDEDIIEGNPADALFEDYYCDDASFTERAYSFRQLTYKWDTGRPLEDVLPDAKRSAVSSIAYSDDHPNGCTVNGDVLENCPGWYEVYDIPGTRSYNNSNGRYNTRYLVNGQVPLDDDGNVPAEAFAEFCHPDWIQQIGGDITREDSSGQKFKDPYELLRKEIDEAVFNTQMAHAAKTAVKEDQAKIWNFIETQLTDNVENYFVETIGHRAGEHFMAIWLDENVHDEDGNYIGEQNITVQNQYDHSSLAGSAAANCPTFDTEADCNDNDGCDWDSADSSCKAAALADANSD